MLPLAARLNNRASGSYLLNWVLLIRNPKRAGSSQGCHEIPDGVDAPRVRRRLHRLALRRNLRVLLGFPAAVSVHVNQRVHPAPIYCGSASGLSRGSMTWRPMPAFLRQVTVVPIQGARPASRMR
jgi:hypothetical protein